MISLLQDRILVFFLSALTRYDDSLLYSGDFTGFIASIYTSSMGQFFGGIILLTMFVLLYIRTQTMLYGAIMWCLVGSAFEFMIPVQGLSVSKIFLILGIASGLFSLFARGRR